jgi:putative ABC transport system permease protein
MGDCRYEGLEQRVKFLSLIWAGLWRKPIRTTLTFLATVAAFVLFGLLQGVSATLDQVVASSRLDRLFVLSRLNDNGDVPLPVGHLMRIREVPGVIHATPLGGLGGYYQQPGNLVTVWAVDPDSFFEVFSEVKIAAEQAAAWRQNRASAIVGDRLAAQYGWKIGDRVPLRTGTPRRDGTSDWTFDIVGIFRKPSSPSFIDFSMRMVVQYTYVDEERDYDRSSVLVFVATAADPAAAPAVAAAIDRQFANSSDETETSSEKDYVANALAQLGNIKLFVTAIVLAVFFTLLSVTGNSVAQSVNERTSELAILKSIGFSDLAVQGIVVGETLILCVSAAVLGLITAALLYRSLEIIAPGVSLPLAPSVIASGVITAVALALATALLPARRVGRMTIVDALADR